MSTDNSSMPERGSPAQRVLLIASSGGHLLQLLELADIWAPDERSWITFQRSDAQSLLAGEHITWAYHPTNRNVKNTLRNLLLAYRVLRRERPKALVTTGAGVAVPFAVVGKLMRLNIIYVESMARITKPSLTGRLLYPIATHFFVQWPELLRFFPRAECYGTVFDIS
jgi:UDP-N-acetylglucosamine:LPS N-acetylglucosamine transferase